jgi:hypothetical protein
LQQRLSIRTPVENRSDNDATFGSERDLRHRLCRESRESRVYCHGVAHNEKALRARFNNFPSHAARRAKARSRHTRIGPRDLNKRLRGEELS